jgi:acetolactate synthase-1/2/3 large subunit
VEKIRELTKGEAIITTDVGQHQMFACQYARPEKPRHFVTSGGLGTMGFGLGASIGASIANPGKVVFNITGDGCFRMNNIELGTAVEYGVPVIVAIMNNHVLGMVRQWQNFFYDKRYSHTTFNEGRTTDFVKLAEAHGAKAYSVTKPEEVEQVLKEAIELRRTVVINFELGPDDKVFPMVPAGVSIDEFVGEEAE